MSNAKKFARNIGSSWIGTAIQIAIVFFLTPFILERLGTERYAVWALVTSLTGYYGLLDVGIRSGLSQYLSRYLAVRDFESFNQTASTGFVFLGLTALAIVPIAFGVAALGGLVFNIPADLMFEAQLCIVLTGITLGLQMLLFPYSAVFTATERFDLSNCIFVVGRLLFAATTYFVLSQGFGLVALAIVAVSFDLLDSLARYIVAKMLVPEIKIRLRDASLRNFREMFSFGGWTMIGNISRMCYMYSDPIVIAIMFPVGMLAPYAIALRTSAFLEKVMTPVGRVFFPAAVRADAHGNHQLMKRFFIKGTRYIVLVAATCFSLAVANAQDFFHLWIGGDKKFKSTDEVAVIFGVLAAVVVARSVSGIAIQLMFGQRRAREVALVGIAEVLINLTASVVLALQFGVIGVAFGTLFSVLVRMWVIPAKLANTFSIRLREFFVSALLMPLAVGALLTYVGFLLGMYIPVHSWAMLATRTAGQAAIACAVVYAFGLCREDRVRWTGAVMQKIRRSAFEREVL